VGSVTLPTGAGPAAHYYLTADGVARVARACGDEPAPFAARRGLGRRALQARLIRLEHLTASRAALIALAADAVARGDAADWRPWPVAWPGAAGATGHRVVLDGEIRALVHAGTRYRAALLWDGGALAPAHLRARVAEIARLPVVAGLPPVLVMTADPWRLPDTLPPAVLWCATAEFALGAPLDAPWHGAGLPPRGLPLRAALAWLGPYARRGAPGGVPTPSGSPTPPPSARTPLIPPGAAAPPHVAVPAAVTPRAWALLATIAAAPFLTADQAARLGGYPVAEATRVIADLARHALLAPPAHPAGRAMPHHTASARGVALLARRADLSARRYGRLYRADAGDAPGGRLGALGANLAHTHAMNEVYVYLARGARRAGLALAWYGEQRAWMRLDEGDGLFYLKPDARAILGDWPRVGLFVECDRHTTRDDEDLRVKFAAYYYFRRAHGLPRLHILAVAPAVRAARLLQVARAAAPLAERADGEWLDLRVTTPGALVHGRLDSAIWRVVGRASPVPLLGPGGVAPLGPPPATTTRW